MGTISALSSGLTLPERILAFLFGASVVLLPRHSGIRLFAGRRSDRPRTRLEQNA
jgi:hypothetical protein